MTTEVGPVSPARGLLARAAVRAAAGGLVTAVLLLVGSAVVSPPVARAHSELVAATPAAASTVSESPTLVTLTFSDGVQPSFAQIAVLAPDGSDVTTDDPATAGDVVEQPVDVVQPGAYTVSYRIVSADGHTVQGTYAFTVTTPPTTPPATPPATPPPTPGPTSAPADPVGEPSDTTAPAAGSSGAVRSTSDPVGGSWPTGPVLGGLGAAAVVVGAGVVWRRLHRER